MVWVELLIVMSLCPMVLTIKIISHNVALLQVVDHYMERKPAVIGSILNADYDVMCLQEVWYGSDVEDIKKQLDSAVFAHTPPMYQEKMTWGWFNAPPCHTAVLTVVCIVYRCSSFTDPADMVDCSVECGIMKESQACISCLTVSGSSASRCFNYLKREPMNAPGVMLLSKRKVTSVKSVFYEPGVKQLLRRAYIQAEIEGVGTILCTHTSSNIGVKYYEPNLKDVYTSWELQNLADAKKLTAVAKGLSKPIIVGDLNTSPAIPSQNVTPDFEGSFKYFLSEGFTSPYVDLVGECTYCHDNPLVQWSYSNLLDHVLVCDHKVLGAQQLYTKDMDNYKFPISDHYGIEVDVEL